MDETTFFEKNRQKLLSDVGNTIQESNNILNDIILNKNKKSKPTDIKLLIALGHKLGYLSGIFNQLYITYDQTLLDKNSNDIIGFKSS